MNESVLLTRPAAQSERFAQRLFERFGADLAVVIAPLQRIAACPPLPAVPRGASLLFTSENGVRAFTGLGGVAAGRVAWCVGARTGAAARAAGFDVRTGPGDAAGLVGAMASAGVAGPVLHLRGAQVTGDPAAALRAQGIPAHDAVVYEQVAQPLPEAGRACLAGAAPVIAPVFSVRSAQLLVPWLATARPPVWLAAISTAVAAALPVQDTGRVRVAAAPDAEAILAEIAMLLEDGSFLEGRTGEG